MKKPLLEQTKRDFRFHSFIHSTSIFTNRWNCKTPTDVFGNKAIASSVRLPNNEFVVSDVSAARFEMRLLSWVESSRVESIRGGTKENRTKSYFCRCFSLEVSVFLAPYEKWIALNCCCKHSPITWSVKCLGEKEALSDDDLKLTVNSLGWSSSLHVKHLIAAGCATSTSTAFIIATFSATQFMPHKLFRHGDIQP